MANSGSKRNPTVQSYMDKTVQVIDGVRRFYKGLDEVIDPLLGQEDGQMMRNRQNIASGIIQIPAAVPATADLIRLGVPAIYNGVTNGEEDKSVLDNIGNAFLDSLYDDEGKAAIQDAINNATLKFIETNPDATELDIKKHLAEYQESDEFHDLATNYLSFGIGAAAKLNKFANDLVGLGIRPDQQTAFDDVMQITGGAIIGVPRSAVKAMTDAASRAGLKSVVNSTSGKVAGRVAELLTPVTLPLNTTNVAANIGVGTALNEGIRYATNEENLVDYASLIDRTLESPAEVSVAAITLGSAFTNRFAQRAAVRAAKEASENADVPPMNAMDDPNVFGGGLPRSEQNLEEFDTPYLRRGVGLIDENAPVTKTVQKFSGDTDRVDRVDALMSSASSVNISEFASNAINFGKLPNGMQTIPMVEIERAYGALDFENQKLFNRAFYGTMIKQDRNLQRQDYTAAFMQATHELDAANISKNKDRITAAQNRYNIAKQNLERITTDDPEARPSFTQWSNKDAETFISAANENPQVKALLDGWIKMSDDIRTMRYKSGTIDKKTFDDFTQNRRGYAKLEEPEGIEYRNKLLRKGVVLARRFKPSNIGKDTNAQVPKSGRNLEIHDGAKVELPVDALTAIRRMVVNSVREVQLNNTRRSVIDELRAMPDAEGTILRKFELSSKGTRGMSEFTEAQAAANIDAINKQDNLVKVYRDGKIEFWQMRDPVTAQVLQFGSAHAVPIVNGMRKTYQQFVTGLGAPWFSPINAFWDTFVGTASRRDGYSMGLIDTYARRLFNSSALANKIADTMFDPTAFIATAAAIPYQIGVRASRTVGLKIASDLANESGFFNAIARTPQGQEMLLNASTKMVEAFDKSYYGIMSGRLNVSYGALYDAMQVLDDQKVFASRKGLTITTPARMVYDSYKALVESIQGSAKTAFFYQNYGTLDLKYKGKIPEAELNKLIQATRNLSGDMSRKSANKGVQYFSSIVPYSNSIIQGTRHIVSAAIPPSAARGINKATAKVSDKIGVDVATSFQDNHTSHFWSRITMGVVLPKVAALAALSTWEGAEDWWYNRNPQYEQMMRIPVPNKEAIDYFAENGEWPEFNEKYIMKIPTPPDTVMFTEPVIAFLREIGLMGQKPQNIPDSAVDSVFKQVFNEVTGFATPPALGFSVAMLGQNIDLREALGGDGGVRDVMSNASGGANTDMMNHNGVISNTIVNALSSVIGSSAQIVAQTIDAGAIEYNRSQDFVKAFEKAFDVGSFEVARRFPQVNPLFNAQHKMNNMTQENAYVRDTMRTLAPLIDSGAQISVERDSKGRNALTASLGLIDPATINDPLLKGMSEYIYENLKQKGKFKEAGEEYSLRRVLISNLESSRTKMKQTDYLSARNNIVKQQQDFRRIQAQELQRVEGRLTDLFGNHFQQQYGMPLTYENLVTAVKNDLKGR